MYTGKLIFTQAIDHVPSHTFRRCVHRYSGDQRIKRFSCQDQYRCMAFAQLTHRESLRDIATCLRAQSQKLYHMGIRTRVSRSTLAEANEKRDWRIEDLRVAATERLYDSAVSVPVYRPFILVSFLSNGTYHPDAGGRRLLCHGSCLRGLPSLTGIHRSPVVLHHSCQVQPPVPSSLFTTCT